MVTFTDNTGLLISILHQTVARDRMNLYADLSMYI